MKYGKESREVQRVHGFRLRCLSASGYVTVSGGNAKGQRLGSVEISTQQVKGYEGRLEPLGYNGGNWTRDARC
jgi:hypothetical protein